MDLENDTSQVIKYMFEADELMQRFSLLGEEIDKVYSSYGRATNMLDIMQWRGEAYSNCKVMNQMIGTYQKQIFGLIKELKGVSLSLCENIETFHWNSGFIKEIESME